MNEKLRKAMKEYGDTQLDLGLYLGLRGYQAIYMKLYGKSGWKEEQIAKVCKRYGKTKEELGL